MKLALHASADLWTLAAARGMSAFGDQVAIVALLLRVHDRGGGAAGVTALLVVSALPTAALAPVAGRLADTLDSRLLTATTAAVEAAICLALGYAPSLFVTLVLVVALQTADALAAPAWTAWVPHIAGPDQTPRALGITQATVTAASLAGPAVGGVLTGIRGARLALQLDAATFVALAAGAVAIRNRRRPAPLDAGTQAARLGDGVRILRIDPLLRPVTITLLCYILVGEAINVAEIFLIRDTLHGSATVYGVIGTITTAAAVAGSLFGGRVGRKPRLLPAIVTIAALQALGMAAVGLSPSIIAVTLAWIVVGSANGALNTTIPALIFRRLPAEFHGRVIAALNGAGRALSLCALGLGALALTHLGARASFVLSGALALAALSYLAVRARPLASEEGRQFVQRPARTSRAA